MNDSMMNRRNFLKTCLAGVAVAAVPSIAFPESNPVEDALALLEKNNCKPLIDGNYIGFCHPDVYNDIVAMGRRTGKTQANINWMIGHIEGMSFHPSSIPSSVVKMNPNQNYLNMRGRW